MKIYIENELLNFQNIVKEISLKVIFELIINFVEKIYKSLNEFVGYKNLKRYVHHMSYP